MEHLSTQVERRQIEWRRAKILELSSQGHSQREIADTIHVGIGNGNGSRFSFSSFILFICSAPSCKW
jgi:hypothetical protein